MRVWTCTDHAGVWPVGVASIVVASSEAEARSLLEGELASRRLLHRPPRAPFDFTLEEVDLEMARAIVLCDGNY